MSRNVLDVPVNPQDVARQLSDATSGEALACLIAAVQVFGRPKFLLDVGCGNGHLVRAAAAQGIPSVGIDIGVEPETGPNLVLIQRDLAQRFDLGQHKADLVLCWEVAEHLPAFAADTICDTLRGLCDSTLLFTAAQPGQGGAGHLNEQPPEFWRNKLVARGFRYTEPMTRYLQHKFAEVAPNAWWYGRNIQVFEVSA